MTGSDDAADQPELLERVAEALSDPHPLAMLQLASSIAATLDARDRHPFDDPGGGEEQPSTAEFREMLLDAGGTPSEALALLLTVLSGDELAVRRVRRELAYRRSGIPRWMRNLDQIRPIRALSTTETLGDGENIIVGVELPARRECTVVVFVDHNQGSSVTDAFAVPEALAEVVETWTGLADASISVADIDMDDARARITEGIETGAMFHPPFESESWPMARPFVEWVAGMMPLGGTGFHRPEHSETEFDTLIEEFFSGPEGGAFDIDEAGWLIGILLRLVADYGPGDPLRFSPVNVEILLGDLIPRKVMAGPEELLRVPDLLRALVRYAHRLRDIPAAATRETLSSIDLIVPEFRARVGEDSFDDDFAGPGPMPQEMRAELLEMLAEDVGGLDALMSLDAAPLPDEPLDLSDISEDVVPRVREVAVHIDRCADALFDAEIRTAARRLLGRVARADPTVLLRRSKPERAAAAVLWLVGRLNSVLGPSRVKVGDMMTELGLTGSASQRAGVFLGALGVDPDEGPSGLRDPRLLTAASRVRLLEIREKFSGESDPL